MNIVRFPRAPRYRRIVVRGRKVRFVRGAA